MGSTDLTTTKINDFKADIIKTNQKELLNYFMKDENKMLKFMSGVVYAIQKIPTLLNDRESLINSVLELAQIGIAPGIMQEAYILPYKGKATAIIGYQGFVRLLYEAGIKSVYTEIVREKDVFKNILGINPNIIHEVDSKLSQEERGEAIGCYVVVKVNGEIIHKYMNKEDIYKFREYSQSYNGKGQVYSPWLEKNDPELNMWKKTVFKQMIKYLPKNEKIVKANEIDNHESPANGTKEVITGGELAQEKAKKAINNLNSNQNKQDGK